MRTLLSSLLSLLLIFLPLAQPSFAQELHEDVAIIDLDAISHPSIAKGGMVASQEAVASQIGADILAQGGNAVDAAVATGFALAVTLPRAGNLGGGGFMLVYLAKEQRSIAIDYREMAPKAAFRDMFLDDEGNVDNKKSRFSHLSSGVPGSVAGLIHALEKYGTLPLEKVIEPAIQLAEKGIIVSYDLGDSLASAKARLSATQAGRAVFYHPDGQNYKAGERLFQKDLAWTLKQIKRHGLKGFYEGEVARRIADDMAKNDGLITMEDLANYKVAERTAIQGSYKGYDIVTMPPPSSGGVHLIQILNSLEGDDLKTMGANSANTIHLMAEVMKQAYADRSRYLGDPDYWDVPVAALTDKAYGRAIRAKVDMNHARPSDEIAPAKTLPYESNETTHFSVMDRFGNVVANTTTLNFSYGSGRMAARTGVLLNNEMDDFSAKSGVPNGYGLTGDKANAIEAGKRPLSSMTPVIAFKDGHPFIATGSPGGSRIITIVLQTLVNVIDHEMNIAEAAASPRIHHQWLPDRLFYEPGISADTLQLLEAKGHRTVNLGVMGSTQSIMARDGLFFGASDPRRPAGASIGVD